MTIYYPEVRINISAVFDGFGGKDTPQVITNILPFSANVHLNSYKEADTWEVTFDAKRFPFSPELLRSAAVEIYMFQRPSLMATVNWNTVDNLMVTGLVDQCTLTQDDQGGTISMSGRDYTALLIDRQWDPTKSGSHGRIPDGPLDGVIQDLVDEAVNGSASAITQNDGSFISTLQSLLPINRTLTVQTFDYDIGITTKSVAKTVTQKKVTIKPPHTSVSRSRSKKRGIAVKADSTYWDVIYKLALSYGYIVYVRGFDVILSKPHVLQAASTENKSSTTGDKSPTENQRDLTSSVTPPPQYRVAYGRNLDKVEVERKLSKEAVPQIRVRSYDPKTKEVIEGRFPSDDQRGDASTDAKGHHHGFVMTGVGTKKEEFKVYTVPDITSVDTLREIARTTYYTLARGEGTIRFSTPHLLDLDNADLLQMRAGDSIGIVWDAFNSETMLNKDIPREKKISTLLSLGYQIDVATLVADQYDKLDYFRQPFYVKEVNLTWDKDQGIAIDGEAMNFINPARDAPTDKT